MISRSHQHTIKKEYDATHNAARPNALSACPLDISTGVCREMEVLISRTHGDPHHGHSNGNVLLVHGIASRGDLHLSWGPGKGGDEDLIR